MQGLAHSISLSLAPTTKMVEKRTCDLRGTIELMRRLWQEAVLDGFESVKERITNVHLRGQLEANEWVLSGAPFGFYEALDTIRDEWNYPGLLTMEPDGLDGDWENLVAAMSSLRIR